jgi:large subunit ribosomal protein L7A
LNALRNKNGIFSIIFVDFLKYLRIISSCMDTKGFSRIPQCGSLPDLTGYRIIVGAKQLRKALQKGIVQRVFLAENADPAITDSLAEFCAQAGVNICWIATMADLGKACGIEVGAAAAAVID